MQRNKHNRTVMSWAWVACNKEEAGVRERVCGHNISFLPSIGLISPTQPDKAYSSKTTAILCIHAQLQHRLSYSAFLSCRIIACVRNSLVAKSRARGLSSGNQRKIFRRKAKITSWSSSGSFHSRFSNDCSGIGVVPFQFPITRGNHR